MVVTKRRLVVLASGNGSNLQAIIDGIAAERLGAVVGGVISDRPEAHALVRARRAGIAARALPRTPDESRAGYDTRLGDAVAECDPDLVVLAGWMRILGMHFLGRFPGQVINLHPARPGELPGTHAVERAWAEARAGQRVGTGVMVHLVPDEGVDDGPVLATTEVPIHAGDTLADLIARVHAAEHALLVETLIALCDGALASCNPTDGRPLIRQRTEVCP